MGFFLCKDSKHLVVSFFDIILSVTFVNLPSSMSILLHYSLANLYVWPADRFGRMR